MINPHQYINLILEPAFKYTGMYSIDAMYLMVCTALVESKLTHLKQLPDGPALGFFEIEEATVLDVFRYLERRTDIRNKILLHTERTHLPDTMKPLISDLALNALIARVKYWMVAEAIPSYKNPMAQAQYYEQYYNVNKEVNKIDEFIRHSENIAGWINHESN